MDDIQSSTLSAYTPASYPLRIVFGFIAGFIATLVFHQLSLWILVKLGVAPFAPFNMQATPPFGVPAMISLAFWGGVWGSAFAIICTVFPRGIGYWLTAFVLGGILPSLVALFVVLPLKGIPAGGGGGAPLLVTAFLINGAWGVGTAIILRGLTGKFGSTRAAPA